MGFPWLATVAKEEGGELCGINSRFTTFSSESLNPSWGGGEGALFKYRKQMQCFYSSTYVQVKGKIFCSETLYLKNF
jgi:hypothetical protein